MEDSMVMTKMRLDHQLKCRHLSLEVTGLQHSQLERNRSRAGIDAVLSFCYSSAHPVRQRVGLLTLPTTKRNNHAKSRYFTTAKPKTNKQNQSTADPR
jgi:hypothetical protein